MLIIPISSATCPRFHPGPGSHDPITNFLRKIQARYEISGTVSRHCGVGAVELPKQSHPLEIVSAAKRTLPSASYRKYCATASVALLISRRLPYYQNVILILGLTERGWH